MYLTAAVALGPSRLMLSQATLGFGDAISLSGDGSAKAAGATHESSGTVTAGGNQKDLSE